MLKASIASCFLPTSRHKRPILD